MLAKQVCCMHKSEFPFIFVKVFLYLLNDFDFGAEFLCSHCIKTF